VLVTSGVRHCPECGVDLDDTEDLRDFFDPPVEDPLSAFVEGALHHSGIDPVLAREGARNWSFRADDVSIRAWCCCSEHLNLTSVVAELGRQRFDELFHHLLSREHAPFSFDLSDRAIRAFHVFSMAEVFTPNFHADMQNTVRDYIAHVRASSGRLQTDYGCKPPSEHADDAWLAP
jgi:hypothetical protein